MGTWLLVCIWVGLDVLVPGEGGEGPNEVCGGEWRASGQTACPTPRGGCGRTVLGPALQGSGWTPVPPTCPGPEHGHPDLPALLFFGDCPVRCQLPEPPLPSFLPAGASVGSQWSLLPGLGAGTVTCLNNNILRIDCHWPAPELGPGPSLWLLFTR